MSDKPDFKNLRKLLKFIKSLPADYTHFDMSHFFYQAGKDYPKWVDFTPVNDREIYNSCGTVACLLGHGPAAGIKIKQGEYWEEYGNRVFNVDTYCWDSWADFLFGPDWAEYDEYEDVLNGPTLQDAIARLTYGVKFEKVPSIFGEDSLLNVQRSLNEMLESGVWREI